MRKSFFNWKVGLNFLIILGIFSGIVWGTFEWLKIHTHHGKEVPVPNVVNMQIDEAVKTLENMGLEVEIDSFKFEPKYKPFQVLQTYPVAGSRVKEGRAIMIKVNPRTWAKVELPDVLDKYKGLAFSRLELVGLKIGEVSYEPNIQKDAVLRIFHNGNEIRPGTFLPKFSEVSLVIGSGPLRNVGVPNLLGLTIEEAEQIIKQNLFEIGLIEHEDGGKDKTDIVYYQDPQAGVLRDQGMQIDLKASKKEYKPVVEGTEETRDIKRAETEEEKGTIIIE
ncbi:MAG: PASTA domain-containing protein [Flavobacteriaceae bacterium]|nr:PASTA domain-containing protein [Flavobacteriaceae bacterium]